MKKIIATVGPSLLYKFPISKIHKNEYIYRINGAHGTDEDIIKYINEIRNQVKDAKILMDLPGNKIRTNLNKPIQLEKEKSFYLESEELNYKDFYKHLKPGDEVFANDSVYHFTVTEIQDKIIKFKSYSNGKLLTNKGLHVRGIHESIPFLFEKDYQLIEIANDFQLSYIGLSFVRNDNDILEAKKYINDSIEIISKIETLSAVNNLEKILKCVNYILIDRGDLSTEIGLVKVPKFQNYIIEKAKYNNKFVFLATQFLKNMEEKPLPTFPEIIDLYNSMKNGILGIQLSEETAVGLYPIECLSFIDQLLNEIESENLN